MFAQTSRGQSICLWSYTHSQLCMRKMCFLFLKLPQPCSWSQWVKSKKHILPLLTFQLLSHRHYLKYVSDKVRLHNSFRPYSHSVCSAVMTFDLCKLKLRWQLFWPLHLVLIDLIIELALLVPNTKQPQVCSLSEEKYSCEVSLWVFTFYLQQ